MENVTFDWFNQYFCTGEHFQSDLDIFQFDFMFVKPHDVPPLLCFNVQTEMRFGVEQLLFTMATLWKQELFYSKSHFSLHVKAKQWRPIIWFHKHKIKLKYVYIRLEMLVEMNIFHVNNRRGVLCLSQGRRMGYTACHNLPIGGRYMVFTMILKSDFCSATVIALWYVVLRDIELCFNSTWLYVEISYYFRLLLDSSQYW